MRYVVGGVGWVETKVIKGMWNVIKSAVGVREAKDEDW